MRGRVLVLVAVLCVAALVLPLGAASAAAPAKATGPIVKVGVMLPIQATIANPDAGDAFKASISAFNNRKGIGKKHNRMQGIVCDTRGDANGEVSCARQLADAGVVATVGDLSFNNPAGVVDILQAAQIPRIGLIPTNVSEFSSTVSFPVSAGPIAAYIAIAVGLNKVHKTTMSLVRTDAPTGATFKGFIQPQFKKAGVDIVGDVAIASGSTDYTPYVRQAQENGANSVLMSVAEQSGTQFIAALAQLNTKLQLGGAPGTFSLETLRKFKNVTKGTLLADSFPYPSQNNVKNFPGLKQFFADMKASGKKNLQPANIKPAALQIWMSMLAFVKVTANLDSITKETVLQALKTEKDLDLNGLIPPWTPSAPGFSLFKSSSNHTAYLMEFDGKNVVTEKKPIDIEQFFPAS